MEQPGKNADIKVNKKIELFDEPPKDMFIFDEKDIDRRVI